jgi:tetratricopeptide (TPR) repeat protein
MIKSLLIIIFISIFISFSIAPANNFISLGNKSFKNEQYQQALWYYKNAILKGESNNAIAYFNYANTLYKINQIGRAIINYEKAIKYAPKFVKSYINLTHIYLELDQVGLAMLTLQKAHEFNPDNPTVIELISECYFLMGDYAETISIIEKGKKLTPEYMNWYYSSVNAYLQMGDMQGAIYELKKILKNHDSNELYTYLGDLQFYQENYEESVNSYNKAININPDNVKAYFKAAYAHEQSQNFYLSISILKSLYERGINESQSDCIIEIARLYYIVGNTTESLNFYLMEAKNKDERVRNGLMKIACDFLAIGKKHKAINLLMQINHLYPDDLETQDILNQITK